MLFDYFGEGDFIPITRIPPDPVLIDILAGLGSS